MCHEILKEEDDEVESLHDDDDRYDDKDHLDDLLDEKNGNNISAKLTSLTLNDNADSVAGLNGSAIINDSVTKTKKRANKGVNPNLMAGDECDSNDNKIDDDSNASALNVGDEQLAQTGDIIKDDAVDVHA